MKLFTHEQLSRLLDNGRRQAPVKGTEDEHDFFPVVKLFTPDANCTWLLTEIDPGNTDIAFGLCDLGLGYPEIGDVSIAELRALRGQLGLPVERDRHFKARGRLSTYADAARKAGLIVENIKPAECLFEKYVTDIALVDEGQGGEE
jgi:hypothetical protein